jgi:hypothetical protein
MHRIRAKELDWNPTFRGVLLSICAATVATLPRADLGPHTAEEYIEHIKQHRLIKGGFESCLYSLDWCAAMYNIAIAMASIATSHLTMTRAYHALSEALAGVRYLVFFGMSDMDYLEQQLLIRLFWVLFAGSWLVSAMSYGVHNYSCLYSSAHLFGKIPIGLFSAEEMTKYPRPLPLTDRQLTPALYARSDLELFAYHGDDCTYIPGLNFASELYMVWQNAHSTPDIDDPVTHVQTHIAQIEQIINCLPPELRWHGGLSRSSMATDGHDTQVANLFITSLHIQTNLLRRFGLSKARRGQYEVILSDLLQILSQLAVASFNANGSSLIPKIRDIAAAYLEEAGFQGSPINPTCLYLGNELLLKMFQRLDDLDCWNNILFIAHP